MSQEQSTGNSQTVGLPESERTYLWRIEHSVLVLDFRFWPGLSAAVRDQNRDKIRTFFSPAVSAQLLNDQRVETELFAFGKVRTATAETAGSHAAALNHLIEYLCAAVDGFDPDRHVSIKTVFLSPQERESLSGPWHGRFLLRVWGKSKDNHPSENVIEVDFELVTLADQVSLPSPWIRSCQIVRETFCQSDSFLFAEVGQSWGFDRRLFHDNWEQSDKFPLVTTGGIYLTDYDLDGRIDVLITDTERSVLYHQVAPGQFEDATLSTGLFDLPPAVPVAFADLDNDGYPDLIAGNQLYHNVGGRRFQHVGVLGRLSAAQGVNGFAIADYDRDGLLDIYATRGAPTPNLAKGTTSWLDDRSGPGNSLFRNLGNWKFEEVTTRSGASAGTVSCFCAAWLDANGDMWPDLFVADEFGSPILLVNQKDGTFKRCSITGDFGGFCMGVAAGDLDDDGRIDLYLANMYSKAGERVLSNLNFALYPPEIASRLRHIVDGSGLWHNCGDLRFESLGRAAGVARIGWAYGPCLADLDNDGRLDIYAPAGFYSVSRSEPDG